jgi:hypothetical protein
VPESSGAVCDRPACSEYMPVHPAPNLRAKGPGQSFRQSW